MGRRSKTGTLGLWMNGERVGRWTVPPSGVHELAYDAAWLASPAARPISLSLPLRPATEAYRGERVEAFFDNLLPDAKRIRERMRRHFKAASARPFDLLAEVGRDCAGALQLLPEDEPPAHGKRIRGEPLSEAQVERLLAGITAGPLGQDDERDEELRISIAGAQEKTALLFHKDRWMRPLGATPTTHILKLPIGAVPRGIDLSTSVENEWLCAQILKAYGLPVAECVIERFGAQQVLVVERFDRRLAEDGSWFIRLPQEDLCQATATPPSRRYENEGGPGIRSVMELLLGSSAAAPDRANFLRAQLVFWLLCGIDGHAKNFSVFLEAGGGYRLTPFYDVLSAYPVVGSGRGKLSRKKVKLAMAVEGKNRRYLWDGIARRHWNETACRCGFARDAESLVEELIARTPAVVEQVQARMPKGFPRAVAQPILEGLRTAARRLASQPSG